MMMVGCDDQPTGSVAVAPESLTTKGPIETRPPIPETPPPISETPTIEQSKVRESRPPDRAEMHVEMLASASGTAVPRVVLSETHRKTCRATTGDVVPDLTVTDIEGTNHQFARLLGDRLTVVLFWTEQSAAGMEQFRRLPVDVLADFAVRGVSVVAVNVGGEVARVRELTGDAADKIVSLVDADGALFRQLATSLLPRTYVLDKDRTILWFDIEYSQSTQRDLVNALTFFLNHGS
jgi:peroxiredoxin